MGRSPHSPSHLLTSSASSPSLRSKESVLIRTLTPTMGVGVGAGGNGGGGGNVKVVVRVRGFLPRGLLLLSLLINEDRYDVVEREDCFTVRC